MKKQSLVLCLSSLALASFGAEETLCSVGVTEICSKLTNTIVAVSYSDLGGGSGMIVSNLVKTTNLTVGDQLVSFKNDVYETWTLTEGAGGAKYWAKADNTFTVAEGGQQTSGTGTAASDVLMGVGEGIWLCRKNPTNGGAAVPFYLYGKPVTTAKSVTVAADTWTLVGNPTQADVNLVADWVTAENNDQIVMFGSDGKLWYYSYRKGKGWRTTDAKGEWYYTVPVIGAGLGFWIRLANGGTINW